MNYVLGFAFNLQKDQVLLIRKNRPDWQAGLINGIGGKVESGETEEQALIREFNEETGLDTSKLKWHRFCNLFGTEYKVTCFYTFTDLIYDANSKTDEIVSVYALSLLPQNLLPSAKWLIPLVFDNSTLCSAWYK